MLGWGFFPSTRKGAFSKKLLFLFFLRLLLNTTSLQSELTLFLRRKNARLPICCSSSRNSLHFWKQLRKGQSSASRTQHLKPAAGILIEAGSASGAPIQARNHHLNRASNFSNQPPPPWLSHSVRGTRGAAPSAAGRPGRLQPGRPGRGLPPHLRAGAGRGGAQLGGRQAAL